MSKCIERAALAVSMLLVGTVGMAQPQALLIDRVVAVVGREAVLHSDLAQRLEQARSQGAKVDLEMACGELEDLLYEKLLLEQGRLDSVVVEEAQDRKSVV